MEKNLTNVPFSTIYFYWIFQQKFGKSHLRLKSKQNHILYSLCRSGVSKVNSNPQFLMGLFHPPPSSRLHEWTSWIQILNHFKFSRVLTRSKNVRHALHSFCVELGMVSIIAAQLSHMEFQTFLWLLRKPTSMKKHHNFDVRRPYFLILKN